MHTITKKGKEKLIKLAEFVCQLEREKFTQGGEK
jgi:hypothetical protein